MYKSLLQECEDGHLKKLISIPAPTRTSVLNYYTGLTLLMIDRLEELYLYDAINIDRENSRILYFNRFEQVVSILYNFTSLEKLTLKKRAKISLKEFDKIVDSCCSLKALEFEYVITENPDDTDMNLALVRTHSRIRVFSSNVAYSEKSVKYIMHKMPNLDEMLLNWKGNHLKLSESTVVDLLKYASRMSYAQTDGFYTENVYNWLIPFMKGTSFAAAIHIGYYEVQEEKEHPQKVCVCTKKMGQPIINLGYNVNKNNFYVEKNAPVLSHKILIEKVGSTIRQLPVKNFDTHGLFNILTTNFGEQDEDMDTRLKKEDYLTYVLRICISLKTLILNKSDCYKYLSKEVRNKSIEKLAIIKQSVPDPDFLFNLSTALPSLKYLITCHLNSPPLLKIWGKKCVINMPRLLLTLLLFSFPITGTSK